MRYFFFSKRLIFCYSLLLVAGIAFSQKYSNEFLSIGVGARAQALGNAVVANIDDVTAAYWNPAGLLRIDENTGLQIGAMHAEWFAGVGKFDYLGATLPLADGNRRLGLSIIRFGIDNIPNTLSLFESDGTINYDNIVEFSAADYAFLLSYAQALKVKSGTLNVGGNVKIVRRIIGSFANSWGFGLDLGMQYQLKKLRLGLIAHDITTTFNAWKINFTEDEKQVLLNTGNELPDINSNEITKSSFLLGLAYRFDFKNFGISPELDMNFTTDGKRNTLVSSDPISIDPGFGVEADYKKAVFLRAGIDQFQKETDFEGKENLLVRPSLGVGLKVGGFQLDYAYTDLGDQRNTYSHVISLVLSLKKRKSE